METVAKKLQKKYTKFSTTGGSKLRAKYQDIIDLPANLRGEILFGQLHTSPRPSPTHQKAMLKMAFRLEGKWGEDSSGSESGTWVFLTEPELHLDRHIIVPDIAAWKAYRVGSSFYEKAAIKLVPDWVCEIQSPSTASLDRVAKSRVYHQLKISYYWLLDPVAMTLEVMKYSKPGWTQTGSYCDNDKVKAEPFADLELSLNWFWANKKYK